MQTHELALLQCDSESEGNVIFESARIELQAADTADGEGKPPRFSLLAYTGGAMRVGFGSPVVVDLKGMKQHGDVIPILFGHDHEKVVGHADKVTIDGNSIRVEGVISGAGDAAREVVASARRGFPWRASIGARVGRMEYVRPGESVKVNGQEFSGPVNVARSTTLAEVSFVAVPADPKTSSKVAAGGGKEADMNFEKWLQARGFNIEELSDAQRETLKAAYEAETALSDETAETNVNINADAGDPAENAEDADRSDIIATLRAETAAEMTRIEAIRRVCGEHAEIAAEAIRDGWSPEKAELAVLRASRPQAPNINVGAGGVDASRPEVLEAAVFQSTRLDNIAAQYEEPVQDAAHKAFNGQLGLQELLNIAARDGGYVGRRYGINRGILRAAFSTTSLPGILSNVANKAMLMAFEAVESTWRVIADITSVKDFKRVTSYRLTGDAMYEQVGPGGELKHATVGEESLGIQADTYGKIFGITRTMIINDDLRALTDMPRKLGRGAALALNDVFWRAFLDNSTFFKTGNNNYKAGSTTAFGIDALTTAEQMFFDQTDADGHPLGVNPAILLVPNALFVNANNVMHSTEVRDPSATKKVPVSNPHAGKFTVARSSYLSNANYTGNSTKAWYLLADPADLPVIQVAFLNGKQAPTVESVDADFNALGIQMRGYHDFGVELQEYRAGVKMKGEA